MKYSAALLWTLLALSCSPPAEPMPEAGPADSPREDHDRELARNAYVLCLLRFLPVGAPDPIEANVGLAAAHSRVLENLHPDRKEEREPHRRHREAGKVFVREALRLDPERGDAHYWLGALLLHTAEAEQSYGRLKEGLKEMLEAEKRDPKCDSGGPDRMIGRIYQETPGWPFLGSKSKAIEYYRKSIGMAPDCRLTHLWLAETLQADKQHDPAKDEARRASEGRPRPGHEKEDADVIRQAQDLLKKLDAR